PGFVSWRSRLRAGGPQSAQLPVVVADHSMDEGYVREGAGSVKAVLERHRPTGGRVNRPTPGRPPPPHQMEAFIYLILAFGILSFALSAVLVAAMIQALMAEQVKQIGMMKAIGARDRQVAGLYLVEVAALAAGALVIGIPLGLLVGRAYAE